MADNRKPKTVHYRRCNADLPKAADSTGDDFILEDEIRACCGVNGKPWIRQLSAGGELRHFLIHVVEKQRCLCGMLGSFSDGKMVPLIDALDDGSSWEGMVEPKDADGKTRKLLENALYFAIRKNHVAVIQTRELDIKALSDFFVWFIHTTAKRSLGISFHLQNLPSAEAIKKLDDHKITGITIGKNAFMAIKTPSEAPPEGGDVESGKSRKRTKKFHTEIKSDSRMMGVLRYFLGDNAILEDLEKSADPGSIHLAIDISYRSRGKKDSQKVMQALAATVGDNPDLETSIRLSGKSQIKGNEMTISDSIMIQCPGGNVAHDDAMTRLSEWLTASIESGKIPG